VSRPSCLRDAPGSVHTTPGLRDTMTTAPLQEALPGGRQRTSRLPGVLAEGEPGNGTSLTRGLRARRTSHGRGTADGGPARSRPATLGPPGGDPAPGEGRAGVSDTPQRARGAGSAANASHISPLTPHSRNEQGPGPPSSSAGGSRRHSRQTCRCSAPA